MRETRKTEQKKFSQLSLQWLVRFLNLRDDDKEVEEFLAESLLFRDDKKIARAVQQKMIDLIDTALKGGSPEGLVWSINDYIAENSESFDPRRRHPPVRPHWIARRLKDVRVLDTRQATLRLGDSRWVVQPWHLMPGLEGQVWLCVVQCLETGDFGKIRRCQLGTCRCFFVTDDARRRFCSEEHRRQYDAGAAKERVYAFRAREKAKALGKKSPTKKPKARPRPLVTDEQRFADFLTQTRGSVPAGELGLFVKNKIGWQAVMKWLKDNQPADAIWTNLPDKTKRAFRDRWGTDDPACGTVLATG